MQWQGVPHKVLEIMHRWHLFKNGEVWAKQVNDEQPTVNVLFVLFADNLLFSVDYGGGRPVGKISNAQRGFERSAFHESNI